MNMQKTDQNGQQEKTSIQLNGGWLKKPMSRPRKIIMIGAVEPDFIGSVLSLEYVHREVKNREQRLHRPDPLIDTRFDTLLSGVKVAQVPSFFIDSYFTPMDVTKITKPSPTCQEIASMLYENDYLGDFFTPEEAHQVAADMMQDDEFCNRKERILMYYRYPGIPITYCLWLYRNEINRINLWDLNYYVTCFTLPSDILVITKDNLFIPPEKE
jgi:hypothetical protein